MESRESWERRWQLAKQRTDAKIIELHQISGNVQVKILYQKFSKCPKIFKVWTKMAVIRKLPMRPKI